MTYTAPDKDWLAQRFEQNRPHLRAVAYRILGSLAEADDAVQESWLRLNRSDAVAIENLGGWLTTVVSRVCLDMLRSRTSRREDSLGEGVVEPPAATVPSHPPSPNPEQEAALADSVGLALLVVLERLDPAQRLAFVLHDMFAVPFDEIASILGRSEAAARQLASRARRRVQAPAVSPGGDLANHRKIVDAFLTALRAGDFEGLLAVLAPDVVVHVESAEGIREIRGAENWAKGAVAFARNVRSMQPVVVDGSAGVVLAPGGRLARVLRLTIRDGKIIAAEIIVNPARLQSLDLTVFPD